MGSPAQIGSALREQLEGEVRFDAGTRHLYATDASAYRQVPVGVVTPRSVEDVVSTMAVARHFDVPVTNRGAGTSLAGQATNVALVIDWSRHLDRILEIDPTQRWARVQPGCVLDDLRAATAPYGLTFGPDPSTHRACTLGGMIGNNACGVHSITAGRTSDNVDELDVLLYDGTRMTVGAVDESELSAILAAGGRRAEIHGRLYELGERHRDEIRARFPAIPRRVSGYNLDELLPERGFHVARSLVGTEGTCVSVLEAKVRLVPAPAHRVLMLLGYPSIDRAGDQAAVLRATSCIGLEGVDHHLVEGMARKRLHAEGRAHLPEGGGWLFAEFGGDTPQDAREQAEAARRAAQGAGENPTVAIVEDPHVQHAVWAVRESALGGSASVPGRPELWPGWEDAAVAPDRLGDYLRGFQRLLADHGLSAVVYGHFGDGCVHSRISFEHQTSSGVATFRRFVEAAAVLVTEHGGSLSGEHGDGQARAELLPVMFGRDLTAAFGEFKAIWDPDARMNPGKVVDPHRIDDDLRFGTDFSPRHPRTLFAYPGDDHDFARATQRCVGVGRCRRDDGQGTMCPSYMATHEEQHSTRGRARLLFEMLQPDAELEGWRDPAVRDALDLCLSCKACKSECPVNVDIATYKAEFLHHHYRRRLRPRAAYSMGLIHWWARAAARAPRVANAVLDAPGLGTALRRAGGVTTRRPPPRFAPETFRHWFARRPPPGDAGRPVILWPDTFTDHFEPHLGRRAVEVLEQAGYQVRVPDRWLCCGRPLYDHGMLRLARWHLAAILDELHPEVAAGTVVVGLEPSCVATFRDELVNLFPHDERARRLSTQVRTLAELLAADGDYQPPRLGGTAVVHGHCHHKAVSGMAAEAQLLDAMGVSWRELDAGCCGLAGSFGFEPGRKYKVSVACAERKLLPALDAVADGTRVVSDGFSCRTQLRHLQRRHEPEHLVELLAGGAPAKRG